MNTNRWMQEVNARFPVRKSKVQKAQFRQYVLQKAQEMGYAARMEENKAICTNRNIVVGDVDKAKVLVTAHYDTPATVGLPNVMLPMNRPMFYLVQALIALVMVVFIFRTDGDCEKAHGQHLLHGSDADWVVLPDDVSAAGGRAESAQRQ